MTPAPATALEARLASLAAWPRRGVAFAAGAASVLAMAPFHLWPVLLLTLPVLVALIDATASTAAAQVAVSPIAAPASGVGSGAGAGSGARPASTASSVAAMRRHPAWRASGTGWWFGFGYFVAGLFWIGEAFLVEAEVFAVLLPFAVTLLPAGLALFWAAAAAAARLAWRPGPERIVVLALALSAAEWLRGHILTGLPWNVLGYALTAPLPLMQAASVLGIYGLTLVTVIALAAPAVLLGDVRAGRIAAGWRLAAPLVALVPLTAMLAFGLLRLVAAEPAPIGIAVRIVQPSVPQREKWRPENQRRIFEQHLDLSQRAPDGRADGAAGIDLIVWPEAAMPFRPLDSPEALAAIGRMLPGGTHLAAGALRLEQGPDGHRRVYNSLLLLGAGGRPVAVYDKIHLVPFGEYLPLQPLLEAIGLQQLTRLRGGFASGVVPRPLLSVPGLPVLGPLICYEAIFPAAVVQTAKRPSALVNVTNDGWFGNTTGPRQHLHQTRVRAVEEGLPVLRAANNGISAVIDGRGRIVARLGLDAVGSIDARLPAALPVPLYARLGDLVFAALWLAALAGLVVRRLSAGTRAPDRPS